MRILKKALTAAAVVSGLLIILVVYTIWGNSSLTVTQMTVTSDKLPEAFDGFRIVQISDLHCTELGKSNKTLLAAVSDAKPDIIVITGDLLDTRWGETEIGLTLASEAAKIAPTYLISGNHEHSEQNFDEVSDILADSGVRVLRNESIEISRGDESITLIGIDDPRFIADSSQSTFDGAAATDTALAEAAVDTDGYRVLLAHRPEYIDIYAEYGVDLVFSGHAHGGQFILPFIGGLYAPGQGLFPEYTEGMHELKNTTLIISRGLGNSTFPFRFNNRPELIVTTLAPQ